MFSKEQMVKPAPPIMLNQTECMCIFTTDCPPLWSLSLPPQPQKTNKNVIEVRVQTRVMQNLKYHFLYLAVNSHDHNIVIKT